MDKEILESRIIDYIDGKGTPEERAWVESELAHNKKSYELYEQLSEVIHTLDNKDRILFTHILSRSRSSVIGFVRSSHWNLDQQ